MSCNHIIRIASTPVSTTFHTLIAFTPWWCEWTLNATSLTRATTFPAPLSWHFLTGSGPRSRRRNTPWLAQSSLLECPRATIWSWSPWYVERIPCPVCQPRCRHWHLFCLNRTLLNRRCKVVVVMISNKIWVLGLLFVVFDHWLYIRQHILSLSEALVLLLALLYARHDSIVSNYLVAGPVVLFIAASRWLNPVDPFEEATTVALFRIPLPLIVLNLFFVLFVTAVVALLLFLATVFLFMVIITAFKSFHLTLKLWEV